MTKHTTKARESEADWRVAMLARVRELIREAEPAVTEERKWRNVPVWSHGGPICTGETYAKVVKLTFFHGASLPDPARLFNASTNGNARRAIDLREGDPIDAAAFVALIRAAIAHRRASAPATARAERRRTERRR